MQFDRKMLDRLCRLNDEQLGAVIRQIAEEAGIDPQTLGIDVSSIQSIRTALQSTSEEDLGRLGEVYDAYRKHRREP
jgi:hypothetical protein